MTSCIQNSLKKREKTINTIISVSTAFLITIKMAAATKTPPGADPKQLERTGTVREIGSQAVWSLSSCKPGVLTLISIITQVYGLVLATFIASEHACIMFCLFSG